MSNFVPTCRQALISLLGARAVFYDKTSSRQLAERIKSRGRAARGKKS